MSKRLPIRVNVGSLWIGRHLLAVGIVVVALIGTAAIFVFARPQYQAEHHAAIKIPAKKVVKFRVAKAVKDAIVPPKKPKVAAS